MSATAFNLHNVRKVFRDRHVPLAAVEKITLDVKQGEFFVFVGPSGCGKSTLLRLMSGLDTQYEGTLTRNPAIDPETMAFVFQNFALLPWLTVAENIGFNLINRPLSDNEKEQRITRELKRFGLTKFANAHPKELSGGMRQRVGMARALSINPKILFMDEPFSELDTYTARMLRKELLTIWQEQHLTIIMVTHLIEEAVELADRIAVLSDRPAQIKGIIHNPLSRPRPERSSSGYAMEDKIMKLLAP